jgi:hypothetical protein
MASQQPESFNSVSETLPKMLDAADANVSVSQRLTSPDYNPDNLLSETGIMASPSRPQLRRDLLRDEIRLEEELTQLLIDREEHKSKEVIEKLEARIKEVRQQIKEIRQELKDDGGH